MGGNNEFFENFERNKYLKKIPSMQRVKCSKPNQEGGKSDRSSLVKLLINHVNPKPATHNYSSICKQL